MKPTRRQRRTLEARLEDLEGKTRALVFVPPVTLSREEKLAGVLHTMQTLDGAALEDELARLIGREDCLWRARRIVELVQLAQARRAALAL